MKKFRGIQFTCIDELNVGCQGNPVMKGGHTHNHQRNALERKLNRSKDSRKRCHNVLNKGYEYKFVLNRCNLVRVKYKIIGLDRAKEGERDKCYASFVRFIKKGIVLEGSVPIIDELESLSPWSKHDAEAILKRPSKDIQDKIGSILFTSTKKE